MKRFRFNKTIAILAIVCLAALVLTVAAACAPKLDDEVRTVTFHNGDEVFDQQTVPLGEKYVFPQNEPTREQPDDDHLYQFIGWTLDPNFYEYRSEIITEPDFVVTSLDIYAAYRLVEIDDSQGGYENLSYKVEFRMPEGEDFGEWSGKTLEEFTQTIKRGGNADIPEADSLPQIEGYTFADEWTGGTLQNVRGNRRVTAVYKKNEYRYTWHFLGETTSRQAEFRTPVDLAEQPQTNDVFVFDGWYMDENFQTEATLTEIPSHDVDLYAKYHVDFSTASVSHEGSMIYGDIRNTIYVSGLKDCDGLNYTFVWTINGVAEQPSDVRFREVKNAGDYNLSVHISADYRNGVLQDQAFAKNEQGSEQFVYTLRKATLSAQVTLSADSVVYGSAAPEASIVYSGFVFDETAESVGVDQDFVVMQGETDLTDANLHVGSYRVETIPHELSNYDFAEISAPAFAVTKKDLKVSATLTSNVYGEGFAYQVNFDGFVQAYNDSEQVLGKHWFTLNGEGEFVLGDRIHAGQYSAQLCGFASDDYNVILPGAETFNISQRPAAAQITAQGGVYGVTPQMSYTLSNVFEEDEERFAPTYTYVSGGNPYGDTSRFVVGSYSVTATFEERGFSDYQTVEVTGDDFQITKRPLDVTVDVRSAYTYGDTVTAQAVFQDNFVFGEDENTNGLVRGAISFVWKTSEGSEYRLTNFETGAYSVVAQGVSALNYDFQFPATQFVVNRKDLTLKVHLQNDSILYGEIPHVAADNGYLNGIEYVGFVFNDTARSVFGSSLPAVTYRDAEGNPVVGTFHAGSYFATTAASHKNYNIKVEDQSFVVNKRTLFVNVELSSASLVYGSKPTSQIVFAADGYDGFFGSEQNLFASSAQVVFGGDQSYTAEQLAQSATKMAAGKYAVTVQGIDDGVNKDYQVTYQYTKDNLTFTIERAPLQITVSAASAAYTYGTDPELTVSTGNFGYSETAQELFGEGWDTLLYTKDGKPAIIDGHFGAGEYHATLKELSDDNYAITVVPFGFSVNKANLTVTVSAADFQYDGTTQPKPTLEYSGFVFNEDSKVLGGSASYTYAKGNAPYTDSVFHAGSYNVAVSGYASDNYDISYVGGSFDVQIRQITLTMGSGWTTYAQDPVGGYNWYSLGGDEILGGESKELTFSVGITRNGSNYVQGSNKYFPHGEYVVTVAHNDNGDYTVTGGNTLTFNVAKLTYNLNVSGAKKWAERANWSVTPRIPDSANRFSMQGSIVLKDPDAVSAGDLSDNEIGNQFVWKDGVYHVYAGDEDVTDNFVFTYTLSVSLSNSDFAVQKPENLTFTFDGTEHTFAVTATADGISAEEITITYNYDGKAEQSQVSIRDFLEGGHEVSYTVHAENAEDATGTFTVIVNKAQISVTKPSDVKEIYQKGQNRFVALVANTNFSGAKDDSEFAAKVTYSKDSTDFDQDSLEIINVKDSGVVNFRIDAGSNYEVATGSYKVAISKATVTLPTIGSKTYNGSNQTAGIRETEFYTVEDNGGVNAATYKVTLTLNEPDNYKWSDGSESETHQIDFVITRAKLTRPNADDAVFTYTATEQTYNPDFVGQQAELFEVGNNVQTNADSYKVTVAIADKVNYEWTDGTQTDAELTFVINKANINVSVPDDVTKDFNNTNHFAAVTATGVDGDKAFAPTVTYGKSQSECNQPSLKLVNVADSGKVFFKVNAGSNYIEATGSYNVTINAITPDVKSVEVAKPFDFDVSEGKGVVAVTKQQILQQITAGVDNLYEGTFDVTFSVTKDGSPLEMPEQFVHAGTYVVTATIHDGGSAAIAAFAAAAQNNYVETTVTYKFAINKRTLQVVLPSGVVGGQYPLDAPYAEGVTVNNLGNADIGEVLVVTYTYAQNNGYAAYQSSNVPVFADATNGDLNVQVDVRLNEQFEYVDDYILASLEDQTYTINIAKANIGSTQGDIRETYQPNADRFVEIGKDKITGIVGDEGITVTYKTDLSGEYSTEHVQIVNATTGTTVYFRVVVIKADGTPSPNYNTLDASYSVIVDKANYTDQYVNGKMPTIDVQINQMGKTLAGVALSNGFRWESESTPLQLGSHSYGAVFSENDPNYNDFNTTLTFETVKEKISLSWNGAAFAAQFNGDPLNSVDWWSHVAVSRQIEGALTSSEQGKFAFELTAVNYKKDLGGTYAEKLLVTFTENDYFELTGEREISVAVKIQTVQWSGSSEWYTIEDALAAATNGTITVKYNTSFADKETAKLAGYCNADGSQNNDYYTVKNGVTLLLPYDSAKDTARKVGEDGAKKNETGFNGTTHNDITRSSIGDSNYKDLELTLAEGLTLTNRGTIKIGGITTGGNGGSNPAGQTCSGYAQLTMGENSVLDSYGDITSFGFIMEQTQGNGSRLVMNSGILNIPFVVVEHRGGTKFSNIYDNMIGSPFNRFYLQNISCVYEIRYGATVQGHANMYASRSDNTTDVKFIGADKNHFIQLAKDSSVVAKHDMTSKVTKWDIFGTTTINALSLTVSIATLSTSGIMFPVSWYHNFAFHTLNGQETTVTATAQDMKILPGGAIVIDKGVTFKVGKLFVYDDTFVDPATSTGVVAAPFYEKDKGSGTLIVNGTLIAEYLGGYVQTEGSDATLQITHAFAASFELVDADNLNWKGYNQSTEGKIWNNNNIVSSDKQSINAGTYKSKNGGWITGDSKFTIDFSYGYQDAEGNTIGVPTGVFPQANNPNYFVRDGMKLQDATLDGYEFVAWYLDEQFQIPITEITDNMYNDYIDGTILRLYGLFKQLPVGVENYSIELNANGDGAVIGAQSSIKIDVRNNMLTEFDLNQYVPVRENYEFLGWYKDSDGLTGQVNNLTETDFVGNSIKLYAKWQIKSFELSITLSWDSDVSGEVVVNIDGKDQTTINTKGEQTILVPYGSNVKITITPGKDCKIDSVSSIPEGYVVGSGDEFTMPAQAVKVNIGIVEDGGLCLIEGTDILLADGTQKKIEDLKPGDLVVVFNHETGEYDVAPVLYNVHSGNTAQTAMVVRLYFSDNTELGIAYQHFLFDLDLNRYVMITTENAHEFVGHKFAKISGSVGKYETIAVTLTSVEVKEERLRFYSPVSVYHSNIIAEGLLTHTTWPIFRNPEGLMNYFEYDFDMKYDEEAMQADIEKYGLYTYADFEGFLSEEAFNAGPWKYFKVAVGKGRLTWQDILNVIDWLYNSGQLEAL